MEKAKRRMGRLNGYLRCGNWQPLLASWVILACCLQFASSQAAAAYSPDPPIFVSLHQTARTVAPGQMVTFTAIGEDYDTQLAQGEISHKLTKDSISFKWESTGGKIRHLSRPTDSPNRITWQAPVTPGDYQVMLTVEDSAGSGLGSDDVAAKRIAWVQVRRGSGPAGGLLRLKADPALIPADGRSQSQITATYLGKESGGKLVNFFSTGGTITPSATTDKNGVAVATLTAASSPGSALVTASCERSTASTQIEFGRGAMPIYIVPVMPVSNPLLLWANPTSLPADGQSEAVITVLARNAYGRPHRHHRVRFRSTLGTIESSAVTDFFGCASVLLRASVIPGPALVLASTVTNSGNLTVNFNPITVTLQSSPLQAADEKVTCQIQAWVGDGLGRTVADGTLVYFSSDKGAITQICRTVNGLAQAMLFLDPTDATATVTAQALSAIGQLQVVAASPGAKKLYLAAEPSVLLADGKSTAKIVAVLLDENGKPLPNQPVAFFTTSGGITRLAFTDQAGKAEATLTAPTVPAVALITAQSGGTTGVVEVKFEPQAK